MGDRAAQALAKAALEPEWEARFEPHSYGFRPGRSCHDAVEAIHTAINQKARYVLDADIAKCFDRIDHGALLRKLATYPRLRRAIKAWLGSGVMDGGRLFPTDEGTPQGGVISPLLANIALHGLETAIAAAFPKYIDGNARWRPITIRYADDFIVLHHDHAAIERAREIASHWLAGIGLELKPSKTRITHTLDPVDGNVGFDFLGFHVRQYRVGKTHTGTTRGKGREVVRLGFKTIITPSKEAVRRHHAALAEIIHRHRTAPQAALISALNPVIRGWTYYYSASAASETFKQLDHLTYWKLARWAKRRHRKKSGHWVTAKYWRLETGRWDFGTTDGLRLYKHLRTRIVRHVQVQQDRSPFDGAWTYWSTRLGRHPELPRRVATLLKWQKGKCAWCGLYFRDEDLPEVDHIIPTSLGGKDGYINWQLVHAHCHDDKTARDGSLAA